MLIEQVLSQSAGGLWRGDAGQTACVVAQLLDDVMALDEEVLLQEVAELRKRRVQGTVHVGGGAGGLEEVTCTANILNLTENNCVESKCRVSS